MQSNFRTFIRNAYGIPYKSVFLRAMDMWGEEDVFTLNPPGSDRYKPYVIEKYSDYKTEFSFSDFLRSYREENEDLYFFVKSSDFSETGQKLIGQILKLDPTEDMTGLYQDWQSINMFDINGQSITVYFDAENTVNDHNFLSFEDLLWIVDYHGGPKKDLLNEVIHLTDKFGDHLVEGDVVIGNNLFVAIYRRIYFSTCKFDHVLLAENETAKTILLEFRPAKTAKQAKIAAKNGMMEKWICVCPVVKASESIISKAIAWKLSH